MDGKDEQSPGFQNKARKEIQQQKSTLWAVMGLYIAGMCQVNGKYRTIIVNYCKVKNRADLAEPVHKYTRGRKKEKNSRQFLTVITSLHLTIKLIRYKQN